MWGFRGEREVRSSLYFGPHRRQYLLSFFVLPFNILLLPLPEEVLSPSQEWIYGGDGGRGERK